MNAPPKPIRTPCIKVCVVDGESGLCLGCYRKLRMCRNQLRDLASQGLIPGMVKSSW